MGGIICKFSQRMLILRDVNLPRQVKHANDILNKKRDVQVRLGNELLVKVQKGDEVDEDILKSAQENLRQVNDLSEYIRASRKTAKATGTRMPTKASEDVLSALAEGTEQESDEDGLYISQPLAPSKTMSLNNGPAWEVHDNGKELGIDRSFTPEA